MIAETKHPSLQTFVYDDKHKKPFSKLPIGVAYTLKTTSECKHHPSVRCPSPGIPFHNLFFGRSGKINFHCHLLDFIYNLKFMFLNINLFLKNRNATKLHLQQCCIKFKTPILPQVFIKYEKNSCLQKLINRVLDYCQLAKAWFCSNIRAGLAIAHTAH